MKLKIFIRSVFFILCIPNLILYPLSSSSETLQVKVNSTHSSSAELNMLQFLTFDQVVDFLEAIENEDVEYFATTNTSWINFYIAYIASGGSKQLAFHEKTNLEDDIRSLFHENNFYHDQPYNMLIDPSDISIQYEPCFDEYEILQSKGFLHAPFKKTKKFVKKHKKEILIGSLVLVGGAAITVAAIALTSAGAAAATTGAVGAATITGMDNKSICEKNSSKETSTESQSPPASCSVSSPEQTTNPTFQINDILEDKIERNIELLDTFSVSNKLQEDEPSRFLEELRGFGSYMTHETLEEIVDYYSFVPAIVQKTGEIIDTYVPEEVQTSIASSSIPMPPDPCEGKNKSEENAPQLMEYISDIKENGHKIIDNMFSTNLSNQYSPENKQNNPMSYFEIGVIPPPCGLGPGKALSNIKKTLRLKPYSGLVTKELQQTKQQFSQLNPSGSHVKVTNTANAEFFHVHRKIFADKYRKAEKFLQTFSNASLSEHEIRTLIHQTGIKTYPRPKGIPENYKVRISNKGGGMIYFDPNNPNNDIRVMPGKPHSPNKRQKGPYVVQTFDGNIRAADGSIVIKEDPKSHIPLNSYKFRRPCDD